MSFRIRAHKFNSPSYTKNEKPVPVPILDDEGKPVLDDEDKPTYKVVDVPLSSVKPSNKLGHGFPSSMQIKTSDRTAECDYY